MNKIVKLFAAVMLVGVIGSMSACKKSFDEPPGPADPNIVANTSIADLKALHTVPRNYDIITNDVIISGIITADDKSGNFYKQLVIQDTTGAIQILLDANSLYGTYPVGRRIYVYCKGLCISDYNSTMQLGVKATVAGNPSLEGIPATSISNYVKGGSINNPVVPIPVTLGQLNSNMQSIYNNALVKLEGFQFTDTMKTYADTSVYKSTTNDSIIDCNNVKTIVRTSAYANFAAKRVPAGNGSITAIYTVFGSTKQFLIRDTTDVVFDQPRCGTVAPPGSLLYETFESQVANTTFPYNPITITGWNNLAEAHTERFVSKIFSSNKYAYMSAFSTNAPSVVTWMVTKGVNLNATTTETLTFETKQDFLLSAIPGGNNVASALKILVSTNYTGTGNPWAGGVTWTDITAQATLSPGSTTSNFPTNYTPSGNINLSSYTGTIYVAFRYEGADNAGTTTDKTSAWEIDNIKIVGN
ncbi:MAG TPA: DUF5689 domain-containing protein [Ferruginibacter sp.]|nr:DUF5689 domain-containing protein [Ferruginibacter sp.]